MEFILEPEFWVAVSFFLFIGLVLYLGVHKKLTAALDHRAELIAKELDETRRLRKEAEAVLADYRKKQGKVENEVENIIRLAAKEAESLGAETRTSVAEYFERRTRLAEDKIGRAEAQALADVRGAAVDAAVTAAETIIAAKLTPEAAAKLVGDSIDTVKSKLN
jgi:F-type H+-transporting ATPase subunit b